MPNVRISELIPKGSPVVPTDLFEMSVDDGLGGFTTRSVTGQNIFDGVAASSTTNVVTGTIELADIHNLHTTTYELFSAVGEVGKGIYVKLQPVIEIDDAGTAFSVGPGEILLMITNIGATEGNPVAYFPDTQLVTNGKYSGSFVGPHEIFEQGGISFKCTGAITGGGIGATFKITMTYELINV